MRVLAVPERDGLPDEEGDPEIFGVTDALFDTVPDDVGDLEERADTDTDPVSLGVIDGEELLVTDGGGEPVQSETDDVLDTTGDSLTDALVDSDVEGAGDSLADALRETEFVLVGAFVIVCVTVTISVAVDV